MMSDQSGKGPQKKRKKQNQKKQIAEASGKGKQDGRNASPAKETAREQSAAAREPVSVLEPTSISAEAMESLKQAVAERDEALRSLWAQQELVERVEQQMARESAALKEKQEALATDRSALRRQLTELKERTREQDARQKDLQDFEQSLLGREEVIIQREMEADAGFAARNREVLRSLESEAEELRAELARHRERILKEREDHERELFERHLAAEAQLEERQREFDEQYDSERGRLKADQEELKIAQMELRQERRRLELDRELLTEDRQAFDERVELLAADRLERLEAKISASEERLDAARQERDALEQQVAMHEEANRRFGDQTPGEVLREMTRLRTERDELRAELDSRLGIAAMQRLEQLESERQNWELERQQLTGQVMELRQNAVRGRIAVTELETLRDQKAALELSNEVLEKTLKGEIARVTNLIRGEGGASPFPTCVTMDTTLELQVRRETQDSIPDLVDFADEVRHRMAVDPQTGKTLYYTLEDVRSFIAGLAMSRLHLLQGLSGTGKTSFPDAFARAIGAGHTVVYVQAGWRDRQDIIGYYNAFEKRYYESRFLLALYEASCPCFRDIPYIIVLDEMNLSHPEQYFADLLSALEQDEDQQDLTLMTAAVDSPPANLLGGGRYLRLPPNVWFVGTANHDETTKDFADKTYDRSHIMELPAEPDPFEPRRTIPSDPVSMSAISAAFAQARRLHGEAAVRANGFLDECLRPTMDECFGVNWGSRLRRQIECYVPVVIACGGTIGEATDHIIATKILRKIRNRNENRPEYVRRLRNELRDDWILHGLETEPRKCWAMLTRELRRLGYDDDGS